MELLRIRNKSKVQCLYIIAMSVALVAHVFNKVEVGGGLKLFHIPAIIAFLCSIFISDKRDNFFKYILTMCIVTLISSSFSGYSGSINDAITYIIVAVGCLGLRYCYDGRFIIVVNTLIPIAIYSLLMLYRSDVYFRYSGYYNDPNYLCTTLIVFLYLIITLIKSVKNRVVIVFAIIELILLLFLITTTVSRAGLLCSIILLVGSFFDVLKNNKIYAVISIIVVVLLLRNNMNVIDTLLTLLEKRADSGDSVDSASTYRLMISMNGLQHLLSHPYLIFTGVGIGATAHSSMIPDYVNHGIMEGDHNTWTSFLSEQGIITFWLFVIMVFKTFSSMWNWKNEFKIINLISFISIIVFSFFIMQKTYLPFWVLFFLLSKVNYENTSHFRLRKK